MCKIINSVETKRCSSSMGKYNKALNRSGVKYRWNQRKCRPVSSSIHRTPCLFQFEGSCILGRLLLFHANTVGITATCHCCGLGLFDSLSLLLRLFRSSSITALHSHYCAPRALSILNLEHFNHNLATVSQESSTKCNVPFPI